MNLKTLLEACGKKAGFPDVKISAPLNYSNTTLGHITEINLKGISVKFEDITHSTWFWWVKPANANANSKDVSCLSLVENSELLPDFDENGPGEVTKGLDLSQFLMLCGRLGHFPEVKVKEPVRGSKETVGAVVGVNEASLSVSFKDVSYNTWYCFSSETDRRSRYVYELTFNVE